jgi:(1->4)-alpha-D-glucan 1-alpha-D-glucosylmutase
LQFRQRHAALFQSGDYLKINILGEGAEHLLAFARKDQNDFAIIVVPRLLAALWKHTSETPLNGIWSDTWLELPAAAPSKYLELFSQCRVKAIPAEDQLRLYLHNTFGIFPFALLRPYFD